MENLYLYIAIVVLIAMVYGHTKVNNHLNKIKKAEEEAEEQEWYKKQLEEWEKQKAKHK